MMVIEKSYPVLGNGLSNANKIVLKPGTSLDEMERIVILETLKNKNFNRTHTARVLGIGIRTLQRKLKKYGVQETNWVS